jgi:hypothetical protein
MMSRLLITELPAYGPSRGGNHPKTLRGPVGQEKPAGPRSHSGEPAHSRVSPGLLSKLRIEVTLSVCGERRTSL